MRCVRERSPAAREDLTPNQLDKRRQIIEAARQVLATQGLAGCTAREIAAAGPLTKSAIHYYFADMDVLIDLAMAEHVAAFEAQIRAAGDSAEADGTPAERFWVTVDAYLVLFRDRPNVAHLWFEYWIDSARKKRTGAISQMHDRVAGLFADLLRATGVASPGKRGRAVLVYLLGAIVDQAVEPRADEQVHADLAALAGLRN
jgi:AcrR family transcriptional regulator